MTPATAFDEVRRVERTEVLPVKSRTFSHPVVAWFTIKTEREFIRIILIFGFFYPDCEETIRLYVNEPWAPSITIQRRV